MDLLVFNNSTSLHAGESIKNVQPNLTDQAKFFLYCYSILSTYLTSQLVLVELICAQLIEH